MLLNKVEETQNITLNEIKCNICETNNKSNIYAKSIMNHLLNIVNPVKKIYAYHVIMNIFIIIKLT